MKYLIAIVFLVAISALANAQGNLISGPTPVTPGTSQTYSCPNCLIMFEDFGGTQYWSVTNGTITSGIYNHNSVTVTWSGTPGTGSIMWRNSSMVLTSKTITLGAAPSTPPTPNIVYECTQGRLQFNGSPPAGVTWYWQTAPSGTSMSNSSSEWVVSNNGTYYFLRAYNGAWSSAASVLFDTDPSTPPAPSITGAERCQAGQLTLTTNSSSHQWFTTSSGGSPFYTGSSYTTTFSATTTYYVQAISAYNCVSARVPVTGTVYPASVAGTLSVTSATTFCSSGTVNLSQSGHTGVVTQWLVRSKDGEGSWSSWQAFSTANASTNSYSVSASSALRTYEFYNSIQSGTCSPANTSTVSVTVNSPITANAGPDLTGATTCGQTSVTLTGNGPGSGTGQWSILSGAGVYYFENPEAVTSSNPTATLNGQAGQTYTLRWTINNGACGVSYDDMVVTLNRNSITANAGADMTSASTCGLTSLTLNGNSLSYGSGNWSIISGAGGSFGNAASPTSTFNGAAGATYTLRWTSANAPCTSSSDDMIVAFNRNPTTANAGSDMTGAETCGLTTVNLGGNAASVGTGLWSIISGSGGSIGNPSSATSSFSGATGVAYTLRWTTTNAPCASSSDDMLVQLNPAYTQANAGPDLTGAITCGQTSVPLAGNGPGAGTGQWSILSGAGVYYFENPEATTTTNPTATFSGQAGQTYTLRWTINNGVCGISYDDMVVTFNRNPIPANAGADMTSASTCGLTSLALSGNSLSYGSGSWSIISGSGGSFGNTSSPTSTFSGTAGATYTLRWTSMNAPCSSSSDDMIVTFNRNPTTANAGADLNQAQTCGLTTVSLGGNAPTVGTGLWSIISGSGGSFGNASSATSLFSGTAGATYTLRWTISNTPCSASVDNVVVTYNQNPAAPTISGNTRFGTGTVTLTATGGSNFNWYNPSNGLIGSGATYVTETLSSSVSNYAYARAVSGYCSSAPAWASVIIEPLPTISSSSDRVHMGSSVTLDAGDGYSSYSWKNSANVVVGTSRTYETNLPDTYTVTVTKTGISGFGTSAGFQVKSQFQGVNSNYILNNIPQREIKDKNKLRLMPVDSISQSIQYFDGLGRPVQTVSTQGSPNRNDIVQPIVYDDYGRESIKYLPYASSEVSGWFKQNALAQQSSFYDLNNPSPKVAGDSTPYAVTSFEPSPLNRVLEQGAPGTAWQPGTGHTITKAYEFNTANEVRLWKYTPPSLATPLGIVTGTGPNPYYAANQLFKNKTKDEHGNEVIEYVDKQGRTVLKRVQAVSGSVVINDTNYASTYYVYDGFGSLVSVIPPEACKVLTSTLIPFAWGSLVGITAAADHTLTKTSATGYTNAGAYYSTALPANNSGWVRMVASETNTSRMIGFAASNLGTNNNIAFALELGSDGHVWVWEDGTKKDDLGVYQMGTSVMVSRESGYVKYYVDEVYKVTSTKTTSTSLSTSALYVDATINETGGTIKNVDISFSSEKSTLTNFSFFYTYDLRRRMATKKVPGAQLVYMVYDNRDRLALTQDGNQRTASPYKWIFTKYDELNRPIMTGIKDTTALLTQEQMQTVVNTYYANMNTTTWRKWGETYIGNIAGNVHGYSNKSYPRVTTANTLDIEKYLTVTYYDNYDFKTLFDSAEFNYKDSELTAIGNKPAQVALANINNRVIGQVTGAKTRMLLTASWLKSINYYDDKYRVVQNIAENPKGHEVTTNVYDFVGKVVRTKTSLYTGQPSSWTAVTNVTVAGEKLISTTTTNWGAGAVSTQTLAPGVDGWVEFTVTKTNPVVSVGLSDVNANNNYATIDYNWYLSTNTVSPFEPIARPYENSTPRSSQIAVWPGDVLRVERINNKIYFKKNGLTQYISTVASATLLMADVAFFQQGAELTKVRLSPTFSTFSATPQTITKRFAYDHAGRLLETWHSLNDSTEILLAKNEYNELGQLVDKKLHSTVSSGTDAKQSVDYRYNIRGWLTSINNAELANNSTNDDAGDLFGMELGYNDDLGTGNAANLQYNGNINAIKWSNNQGLGDTKGNAYNYTYDALNRLVNANHLTTSNFSTYAAGEYDENIIGPSNTSGYDLNGNIKYLKRKGKGALTIDDLTYNYGTGTNQGNRIFYVQDNTANTTDKRQGFLDGNIGTATDYTYDGNGNMTRDLNKGVGTTTSDGSNLISYNHLNLPDYVQKPGGRVTYLYDATGRKLGQVFASNNLNRTTDYVNAWVFENNDAQFVQHEEGRIALQEKRTLLSVDCSSITPFTPTASMAITTQTTNGETYVRLDPTDGATITKLGVTPIGDNFTVTEGQRYIFRAKGYTTNSKVANLYVKGNTADFIWVGANLNTTATAEMWVETDFIIPAGITQISLGILFSTGGAAVAADYAYVNGIELIQVNTLTPEYQYNLKDHLGNVRLTFTSKQDTTSETATLESANANTEQSQFVRYNNAKLVNSTIFDRTNGSSTGNGERLNGSANEKFGIGKSLSVMPGDVINAEVYAKYVDAMQANWTGALTTLMNQIAANTAGVVVEGGTYISSTSSFPFPTQAANNTSDSSESGPKAYLNWLVFDRNYNLILGKCGYDRISTAPKENGQDVAHERLFSPTITIDQPGYVYIYLSNEETTPVEVFFDDLKIDYTKSPVVQQDDYYPFGLTFNSYSRENSTPQDFKYNGKEIQDELNLGLYDYLARQYDPATGRFTSIDPAADLMRRVSPYAYAFNNPVRFTDPDGMVPEDPHMSMDEWMAQNENKEAAVDHQRIGGDVLGAIDEKFKGNDQKGDGDKNKRREKKREKKEEKKNWGAQESTYKLTYVRKQLSKLGKLIVNLVPDSWGITVVNERGQGSNDGGNIGTSQWNVDVGDPLNDSGNEDDKFSQEESDPSVVKYYKCAGCFRNQIYQDSAGIKKRVRKAPKDAPIEIRPSGSHPKD